MSIVRFTLLVVACVLIVGCTTLEKIPGVCSLPGVTCPVPTPTITVIRG